MRHGGGHCTIQLSVDIIVVTGGDANSAAEQTYDYVTQYHLSDGTENPLTPLGKARGEHACGAFQDADDQTVSKILCSFKEFIINTLFTICILL